MIYSAFVNSLAIFLLVLLVFLLLHNLYQTYEHFRTARAFQRHSPHALFIPLSVLRKQPLRRAGLPQYLTNTVLQTHEQATASTRTMNEVWHKRRKDKKGGRKVNTIVHRDSDYSVSKGRLRVVRGSASSLSSAAALVDATRSEYSTTTTIDQAARSQSEEQGRSVKASSYASATQRRHQQGSVNTVPLVASRDKTVVRVDTSLLDTSQTGESSTSNTTVPLSSSLTQSAHSMSSGEYYANRSRQRRRSHTKRQAQYGASQEENVRQGSYRPTTTTNAVGGMYDMSMPFLSRAGVNLYENLEYDDYIHIDIWNGALDTAHVLERLQHNLERTADSSQTRVIGIRLPAQALPKGTPALQLQQCGQAQGSNSNERCALMLSSQLQCTTTKDGTNGVATRHAEGEEGRHGIGNPVSVSATYIVGADNTALLRHLAAGIWRTTTTSTSIPSSYMTYTAAGKEERMSATLVRLLCHFTQNEELVCLRASRHATQSAPPNVHIATSSHSNNNSGPHSSMMPLRHTTMPRLGEHTHHDNSDSYVFSSPGSSMTSSYGWRQHQVQQLHDTQMNNEALMTRMEERSGNGNALRDAAIHNRKHSAEGVAYNGESVAHVMSREEQEHAADSSMAHDDAKEYNDSNELKRATLCLAQSETPQYDLELIEPMPRTLVKTRRQGKKGSARYGKGYAEAYCDVSTTATLSPKARRETKMTKSKEGKAAAVRQYMQAQVESDVQEMELLPMWRRSALLTSLRSGRLSLGDLVLSVLRDRLEAYHDIFSHYSDDDDEEDDEEYFSNSENENDAVGRHAHRFHTGSDVDDDIRPVGHSCSSEEDVHDEREAMRHAHYHPNGYRSRMSHESNSHTQRRRSTVNAACAYASWQDTVAAAAAVVAQMQIHKCHERRAEELRGLQMGDSALRRNGGVYDVLQDYVIAFTLCSTLQPFTQKPQYGDTSALSRFTSDVAHTSFCSSSNHSDRYNYNYNSQQNDNVDAEMSRAMSWAGIVPGANVELLYGATVHDLATTLLAQQRSNTSRGVQQAQRSSLPGLMHRATFSYLGTDTTTMNHSTTSRDVSSVLRSRRNTMHYRHLSSSFSSCPRRVDSMDNLGTLEQHSTMTSHTESVSSTFRPLIERTATGPGLMTDILSQPDERLLRSAATLSPSATNARGSPASSLSSDSYPATVVATEAHTRLTGPTTTITNSGAGHHRAVNVNNTQPVEPTSNNTSETNLGSMSMTMLSSVIAGAGASASASPTQFAPLNMDHCMSPNTREAEASGHVIQRQSPVHEGHTTQEGGTTIQHEAVSAVAVGNNTSSHKLSSTLAHPATQAILTATAEAEGGVKEAEHSHTLYVADAHTNPAIQSESEHDEDVASDILDALRDGAQLEGGLALPTPLRYIRLGTALYVVHEVIDKTFLQYRERRTMPTPLSSRATSCYGDEKGAAIRKDDDAASSNASITSTRSNTGGLTRRHDRKSAAALKRAERERRWAATRRFAEVGYSLSAGLETTNAYGQMSNNNSNGTPCAGGSGWVREEVRMCWRCLSVEATVINLPCGHFATCAQCAALSTTCCVCNTTIDSTITLY